MVKTLINVVLMFLLEKFQNVIFDFFRGVAFKFFSSSVCLLCSTEGKLHYRTA